MRQINVDMVKMYDDVVVPKYETEGSAGCDVRAYLRSPENQEREFITLGAGDRGMMVSTGIKVAIPRGYYMAVVPRSGMAVKTTMRIANQPGTVDSDYRNEVKIIVDNIGDRDLVINHQDRIAQFVFLPYYQAGFTIVENLRETKRTGGFGSTGTNQESVMIKFGKETKETYYKFDVDIYEKAKKLKLKSKAKNKLEKQ